MDGVPYFFLLPECVPFSAANTGRSSLTVNNTQLTYRHSTKVQRHVKIDSKHSVLFVNCALIGRRLGSATV